MVDDPQVLEMQGRIFVTTHGDFLRAVEGAILEWDYKKGASAPAISPIQAGEIAFNAFRKLLESIG